MEKIVYEKQADAAVNITLDGGALRTFHLTFGGTANTPVLI